MKVVVIGAGPAGLMCASQCNKNNQVIVIEQNEKIGKKLYITGKGRCNVTNNCDFDEFYSNIVTNPKFLYGALKSFTPQDTMNFIENNGTSLKTERGNRVFPVSDKASDITKALENANKNTIFKLNEKVLNIEKNQTFVIKTTKNTYEADCVVICVGGKSYPTTGSDGSLYGIIKKLGHTIVQPLAALCPIVLKNDWVKDIEGISLKNVNLTAFENNKTFKTLFGEMLFTRNGISGPIELSMSSYINKKQNISLEIDFKPALSLECLEQRVEREYQNNYNNIVITMLKTLLPKNLALIILKQMNIEPTKIVRQLNERQRKQIAYILKHFKLDYDKIDKLDYAIVTSGGVDVKEINPKTMQSKLVEGLYFAGEVIDIDALTGGFNIQLALSTGFVAGNNIKENSYGYCD
ncbi:MAG: NAD(P)/FAD-dependent oxidoreductase [Clostridia bacterium]|nr:NAD(P)/FAD-dependent oxidoreductase [Clostridia bacterium]